MSSLPHYIDLDLKRKTSYEAFAVTQNDTDVVFIIRVSDNGLITDTLLDNFTTITLTSVRPKDRKAFYVAGEKVPDSNEVRFELGTSELANTGKVEASIQLYSVDGRVSSAHFTFEVRKDHTGEYVPSENEASLIETVLVTGPQILADAEAATAAATTATTNLETDKTAALAEMSTATAGANTAAGNADSERVRMVNEVTQVVTDVDGVMTYIQDDFLPNTALALSDMDLVVQENTTVANAAKTTAEGVEAQFNQIVTSGPVQSVNGQTGIVSGLALQSELDQTNATLAEKAKKEDVQASLIDSFLNTNTVKRRNLAQVKTAIAATNCVVTFWGDSIVDNGDAVSLFSTFRKVFERMLTDSFRSCSFTYNNRGIGGRTVDHAADPNYVGVEVAGATDAGFLMPWSVVGQSWRDNVKATAPDLLVLHFGMNSYSTSQADASYQAIYDFVQTWTKIPTILVIPNFLPNPIWAPTWQYRLDTQRTARYFAERHNLPSADIGRVHRLLRDGVDELQVVATSKDTSLSSFGTSSATTLSNGFTINSGGQIVYNKNMNMVNFELKFKFSFTGVEQFTLPYLRNKYHVRYTPSSGILQLRNASTLAVISSFVVPVIPNGTHTMTVQVFNSRVFVEVAGYFEKTLTGLTNGIAYTVGVKPLSGSLTVTDISLTDLEFNKTTPILTDKDFLGAYDPNDLSIKLPYGGNGVNHPSAKGILTMYQGEFQKFVDAL